MPMPDSASPEAAGAVLQTIIDNLPSAVTYFDSELRMVACNKQLVVLLDFPASPFERGLPSLFELALFNARRGEYGPGEPEAHAHAVCERARAMQPHVFERVRPDGTVLEVRGTPLPDGGFVTIYTGISERKRAEQESAGDIEGRWCVVVLYAIVIQPLGGIVMPTASAAVLSVRVNASERALLEAAAEQASTSLSDFVRRRALEAAESDLLNRRIVTIPAKDWARFEAWASAPATEVPALRKLSRTRPVWQK